MTDVDYSMGLGRQKNMDFNQFQSISDSQQLNERVESDNSTSSALVRQAQMLTFGVLRAAGETLRDPASKLPEVAASATIGGVMGHLNRAGVPGKILAAGAGSIMLGKAAYDEVTGERWSKLGSAISDNWRSGANMERNIEATKSTLGALAVDLTVGTVGFKIGSKLTSKPDQMDLSALKRAGEVTPTIPHQAGYRWVPPRGFSPVDMGTPVRPSAESSSRIVGDKLGRVDHISLAKDASHRDISYVKAVAGYARLTETDPLAWQAAKNTTLLGRIGLLTDETVLQHAVRGSNDYIKGGPANAYSDYLTNRYGKWTLLNTQLLYAKMN